jgi:hypothetical protein
MLKQALYRATKSSDPILQYAPRALSVLYASFVLRRAVSHVSFLPWNSRMLNPKDAGSSTVRNINSAKHQLASYSAAARLLRGKCAVTLVRIHVI